MMTVVANSMQIQIQLMAQNAKYSLETHEEFSFWAQMSRHFGTLVAYGALLCLPQLICGCLSAY